MSLTKLSLGSEMSLTFFNSVCAYEDAEVTLRAIEAPSLHLHHSLEIPRSPIWWRGSSNEKKEGEKQREVERRGDQKEDALSAFRSCFFLFLNIQPPYSIGLEPGGHTAASNLKAQMRSRRERSRERMSGAQIKRRMRFRLFGLASSSSSTSSLRIRLASSLLEVRRPASISLLRLSRSWRRRGHEILLKHLTFVSKIFLQSFELQN
jgi:hypothetical protein